MNASTKRRDRSTKPRRDDRVEDRLDAVFGALSDRTRRHLLSRLALGPATITELATPFAMTLPAVSKHIRILEGSGLIRRTVDGRLHHCELDPAPLRQAEDFVTRYRAFWDERLEALARHVEEDQSDE